MSTTCINCSEKRSFMVVHFLLFALLFTLGQTACGGSDASNPLAPQQNLASENTSVARWEARMKTEGRKICTRLRSLDPSSDQALAQVYYDGNWVFWQISDYTKDASWLDCARIARNIYRDNYVIPNQGKIPGYWNFSHGFREDVLRTDDATSKKALELLTSNAAFSRSNTPLAETKSSELSREVAYALMGYLNAHKAGLPLNARFEPLRNQAFDHLTQWFETKSAKTLKPFMVALTAQALIESHENKADPRTVPQLKNALEKMWDRAWDSDTKSFRYQIVNPTDEEKKGAPDLNLLIAPAYMWIYKQTKDPAFKEKAERIFKGGIEKAFLGNGKQFNQNYRWSFRYVSILQGMSK